MNPSERFWSALKNELPDQIPLTIWNNKLPGESIDDQLFDLEMLLINKSRVWENSYDVLAMDWLKRVNIVAASPAKYSVIEGNTDISIVGDERFNKYYFPFIERACEILHDKNILAGAHLDANNKRLAPLVARTSLDFIESFTPPPDCDMTIEEAKDTWPDKAMIIHFPSSVHLFGEKAIKDKAQNILKDIQPGKGFVIGTMEDIPDRGRNTLVPMYQHFRENGRLPLVV